MNDAGFEPSRIKMRTLGEIAEVQLGKTPRKADYLNEGTYKIVKFRDILQSFEIDWKNRDKGFVADTRESLSGLREIRVGDVLVTASAHMSEHIGKKAALVKVIPARFKAAFVVGEILQIRLKPGVDPRWILYYIRSRDGYKAIQNRVHGVHLISSRAREIAVPIGDFDQQQRVLGEIEKQFSRLDEAVANVKRVKAKLKRYKAAVLKAAVEGRLVPTEADLARRAGRSYETGGQLLQRILEARRSQWKRTGKYKEFAPLDTSDLPDLPEGWVWACCDHVFASIEAGASFKCVERPPLQGETGVLKVSAVTWGAFDENESKTCMDSSRIDESYLVQEGDFLFSRANTIELVGACVIVGAVTKRLMLSDKTLRFRFAPPLLPAWLLICLRSSFGRHEIERLATGNQESMRNIGQERIRQIRISIPPKTEQHRIVAEVDRRLSLVREVEAEVDTNLRRAERLRQATLQEAFAGASSAR